MGELSEQLLEGALPLLPGWAIHDEMMARRATAIRGASDYYDSLTVAQLVTVARARERHVFARIARASQLASGCPEVKNELKNWFIWMVDRHEGHLEWAVEAVMKLAAR